MYDPGSKKKMESYGLSEGDYSATADRLRALAAGGSEVHREALEAYERDAELRKRLKKVSSDVIYVWPENQPVVRLFIAMRHRWHTSMAGYTGLDLSALPIVLNGLDLHFRRTERKTMVRDLLILEEAALEAMHPPKKE